MSYSHCMENGTGRWMKKRKNNGKNLTAMREEKIIHSMEDRPEACVAWATTITTKNRKNKMGKKCADRNTTAPYTIDT